MKYLIAAACLTIIFTLTNTTYAQNNIDEQINKIEGSIDKITITADDKEYTFEGSDAEKLFKRMKKYKSSSYVWHTSDDESSHKKVVTVRKDGDKEIVELEGDDEDIFIVKSDDDFEWNSSEGMQKKVKVEVQNGEKKVTVTTKENGEETTEVYEGDEADEYIEKMKSENDDFNIEIKSEKDGKKVKKIIIETEKEENDD